MGENLLDIQEAQQFSNDFGQPDQGFYTFLYDRNARRNLFSASSNRAVEVLGKHQKIWDSELYASNPSRLKGGVYSSFALLFSCINP